MSTLAFVEKSQGEYWDRLNCGAANAAHRNGDDIRVYAAPTIDVLAQTQLIDAALDDRPDALVVVASDPAMFAPQIERSFRLGVPVLTMDLDGYESRRLFHVGTLPFIELGRLAAEMMLEKLEGDGPVIVQAGSTAPGATGKLNGFLERMAQASRSTIIIEPDFENPDVAFDRALTALNATADVAGLYGVYAYHCTVQARAVEASRRQPGSLPIVGFDMTEETVRRLADGSITASIWIREYSIGAAAATAAGLFAAQPWDEVLDLLGGSLDDRRHNIRRLPVTCITKEGVSRYTSWLATHR